MLKPCMVGGSLGEGRDVRDVDGVVVVEIWGKFGGGLLCGGCGCDPCVDLSTECFRGSSAGERTTSWPTRINYRSRFLLISTGPSNNSLRSMSLLHLVQHQASESTTLTAAVQHAAGTFEADHPNARIIPTKSPLRFPTCFHCRTLSQSGK